MKLMHFKPIILVHAAVQYDGSLLLMEIPCASCPSQATVLTGAAQCGPRQDILAGNHPTILAANILDFPTFTLTHNITLHPSPFREGKPHPMYTCTHTHAHMHTYTRTRTRTRTHTHARGGGGWR